MKTAASKYHNRKVTLDGLSFDSVAEAGRYGELRLRWLAGEIINLEVHPRLLLVPAFVRVVEGTRHTSRPRYYVADFSYREGGRIIIEDVKDEAAPKWISTAEHLAADKVIKKREDYWSGNNLLFDLP